MNSNKEPEYKFCAVVPAAGRSARMQGQNKLLADLNGKPLILRTIEVLAAEPRIGKIILSVSRNDRIVIEDLLKKFQVSGLIEFVDGGKERQGSVYAGILRAFSEYVVIHDGARPLLTPVLLGRLLDQAVDYSGVVPAIKITDTIKRVNDEGFVVETLDRRKIFQIQTPQVFKREVLVRAHKNAGSFNNLATDDASLLEMSGYAIKVVPGSGLNLKITTPEDLELARAILKCGIL